MARFGEVPGANTIVRCIGACVCTLLAVAGRRRVCGADRRHDVVETS
jgi:hypothetical protein